MQTTLHVRSVMGRELTLATISRSELNLRLAVSGYARWPALTCQQRIGTVLVTLAWAGDVALDAAGY